jgi:hypothetical protein
VYLLKEYGLSDDVDPPPTSGTVGLSNLKFLSASAMADAEKIDPGDPPFNATRMAATHEMTQHNKPIITNIVPSSPIY